MSKPLIWYWYDVKFAAYRIRRFWQEGLPRRVAWMIPERIAYWTFIRVACRKDHLCRSPDDVTILDVLNTFPGNY